MLGWKERSLGDLFDRAEVGNELRVSFSAEAHHPHGAPHGQNNAVMAEGHGSDVGRGG